MLAQFINTFIRKIDMRIITGKAKGVRLVTLEGETTRPTAERVKEAVFSMLQFDIEGRRVLDLFAGSGQMALEAISRGAAYAVLVDKSKEAEKIIAKNIEKTRLGDACRVFSMDYAEYIRRYAGEKFDIVFLDPPYAERLIPKVLPRLLPMLKPTSTVICESAEADVFGKSGMQDNFEIIKQAKYGVAYITILRLKGEAE